MLYPRSFTEEIKEGDNSFTATLYEVENAVIAFFNEIDRMKLGTIAVATPRLGNLSSPLSSIILGNRNKVVTKILAERISITFNKIALVSTHLKEVRDDGPTLIRLLTKLLEKT